MKKRADGRKCRTFTYNGKRYFVYGYDKQELDQKEYEKRQELENRKESRDNPTLSQYYEKWTDARIGTVKESTANKHAIRFNQCAKVTIEDAGKPLGDLKLKEITPDDIREVQRTLQDKRATQTVNDYISTLSHVFSTAVKERRIDYNPCIVVKPLKRTEPHARDTIHRALTPEEVTAFMDEAEKNSFYYDVFRLALATGMRVGEIGALTLSDIKGGFININKTITQDINGGYVVGDSAKTEHGQRRIPINSTIKEIVCV